MTKTTTFVVLLTAYITNSDGGDPLDPKFIDDGNIGEAMLGFAQWLDTVPPERYTQRYNPITDVDFVERIPSKDPTELCPSLNNINVDDERKLIEMLSSWLDTPENGVEITLISWLDEWYAERTSKQDKETIVDPWIYEGSSLQAVAIGVDELVATTVDIILSVVRSAVDFCTGTTTRIETGETDESNND